METTQSASLMIDKEFSLIFVPRKESELKELKHQLTYEGLQPTISTWYRVIIDGIDIYKICAETGIPFRYEEKDFFSRNEVISDICLRELQNPNITLAHKKYCIGKLGNAQRTLIKEGYTFPLGEPPESMKNHSRFVLYRWRTKALLPDTKVSMDTIYSYTTYANAVDSIYAKTPAIAMAIINETQFISLPNIVRLSELPATTINIIWNNLHNKIRDANLFREIKKQNEIDNAPKKRGRKRLEVEIKKMPQYDPDAEFSSLALTVPMWNHSLTRLFSIGNFSEASTSILKKLDRELNQLKDNIENLQNTIEGELDD